jgi:hypothetical protein
LNPFPTLKQPTTTREEAFQSAIKSATNRVNLTKTLEFILL